ncbi:hypothetical protein ACFO3J_20595 [Streptomyces polygonati]|uniref:Uncharacterized protein n=1 Tax=Streptomyces polygonati TaxID=1617087 RepID=A0ABV8HPN4_9ACTN
MQPSAAVPFALRCFYLGQGVLVGGALTGGTIAYDKWSKRRYQLR